MDTIANGIATEGGTPLVVAEADDRTSLVRVLGVIQLKDVVKTGMRERFDQLRAMGIRTVMITGDNPLTAGRSPKRLESTTSWPRPHRRTRWRSFAASRPAVDSSR